MHFGGVNRSGDLVLRVDNLAKAYDQCLFRDLTFDLKREQCLGIVGANGSGKTTLLRILLGDENADEGEVQTGHLVEFGYYDQHLDILPEDELVLHAVWPDEDPESKEQADAQFAGSLWDCWRANLSKSW